MRELKRKSAQKRLLLVVLKSKAEVAVQEIEIKQRELEETRAAIQAREADLAAARTLQVRQARQRARAPPRARGRPARAAGGVGAGDEPAPGRGPAPAGPIRQGGGGYIWPVNGPVVSPFGMRWGRLHAGVDIAVPAGTPIRAAASGTVAMAGWMGGYGQYTCIQHGGGVATCYAHQSSIGVGSGASVKQGQVIGSVGCTGHCFGDHLHFEVRINGSPVDPMGYL